MSVPIGPFGPNLDWVSPFPIVDRVRGGGFGKDVGGGARSHMSARGSLRWGEW